jgi:hypothetical protein
VRMCVYTYLHGVIDGAEEVLLAHGERLLLPEVVSLLLIELDLRGRRAINQSYRNALEVSFRKESVCLFRDIDKP